MKEGSVVSEQKPKRLKQWIQFPFPLFSPHLFGPTHQLAFHEGIEASASEAMAFIYHDRVPVTGAKLLNQPSTCHAIDGGEQVAVLVESLAAGQDFAKVRIAQHLAIGAKRLAQDFFAVSDEQQPLSVQSAAE